MSKPFVLGVNYWPSHKGPYWWSDFDAGEVQEEFSQIAGLGLTLVRLFLTWDDWQPAPDTVSTSCLKNLVTVCNIADDLGLRLNPTFFCGFMSGTSWAPGWLLNDSLPDPPHRQVVSGGKQVNQGYYNPFTNPTALEASRLQLRTVVDALKDHPAVAMWDLGNEPDGFARPPNRRVAREWVHEMTGIIKSLDPDTPVTYGMHMANLDRNNALRLDDVFSEVDVAVMHPYPLYCDWARGPLDSDLPAYACALTSALCGKPTLMQEFGGCTAPPGEESYIMAWEAEEQHRRIFMASEEAFAEYVEQVLPKVQRTGATGAMIWSYKDYVPALWGLPPCNHAPHERFFGLVRNDGTPKPHAKVIQKFAESKPIVQPATHTVELDITPDEYYRDAKTHLVRLYDVFLSQ